MQLEAWIKDNEDNKFAIIVSESFKNYTQQARALYWRGQSLAKLFDKTVFIFF